MSGEGIEELEGRYTPTEEAIMTRRSVRRYGKKQVPEFLVRRILEAGRFAPSAGNRQPWKFVVVRDPSILDGITRDAVATARSLAGSPGSSRSVKRLARGRLGLFHGAPTVILIFKEGKGTANPDLDCGIAGQNMVLAAQSMGLGTCWVSLTGLAFGHRKKWSRFFGIEPPYKFLSSITVGWPADEPGHEVSRRDQAVEWYEEGSGKKVY